MAFARIFGVEHLAQGENWGAAATGFGLAGLNLGTVSNTPASGGLPSVSVNGKVIEIAHKASASSTNMGGGIAFPMKGLWGADVAANGANIKRLVLGMRVDVAPQTLSNPIGVVYNNNTSPASFNSSNGDLGFQISAAGAVRAVAAGALGATLPNSFYAEWSFRPSGTTTICEFYVDGVLTASYTSTRAINAVLNNGQSIHLGGAPSLGMLNTTARVVLITLSNMYSLYDDGTAGDLYIDRQGPITVRKLPVVSVDANNWTVSDGSTPIKTVVNKVRDGSGLPNVTSAGDASALVVNIDPSSLIGNPTAVQIGAAAVRPAATAGNLDLAGVYGGSAIVETIFTDLLTDTNYWDRKLKPLTKLGADALTKANLANLKISLKPT